MWKNKYVFHFSSAYEYMNGWFYPYKKKTWKTDRLHRKATIWARWKDPGIKQECYSGILQISLNKNWLANYMLTAGRCLFIYILKTSFAFVDKHHPQGRRLKSTVGGVGSVQVSFIVSASKISNKDSYVYDHMSTRCVSFLPFETRNVLFPERHDESRLSLIRILHATAVSKRIEKYFHEHKHEINV